MKLLLEPRLAGISLRLGVGFGILCLLSRSLSPRGPQGDP